MRRDDINWTNVLFIAIYHAALFIAFPLYLGLFTQSLGLWIATAVLIVCCGMSVTTLYHRYYSHKSYKLHPAAQSVILFFGTLAFQGSAINWAHDHRLHHKHVDTDADPYSINKGFWYAHIMWLFEKRDDFNPKIVSDLYKNRLVVFQHRYYVPLTIVSSILVVSTGALVFNDWFGAFTLLFLFRLFFNHHTTWFINSLAHTWGSKPFSKEHSAVNNWIISLLTYGEGYHNYHHTFEADYRNGVRWYQFDPTKILILVMSKIGLAKDLRRVDSILITKKLLIEDKHLLLEQIKQASYVKFHELENEIDRRVESLSNKLSTFAKLVRQYRANKKVQPKQERRILRARIKEMRRSIRVDLRAWTRLCNNVLRLKPQLV